MKIKQQFKKVIPVVLLAIGFFVFMNFYQNKEQVIEVDPEKFKIVDSEEALKDELAEYVGALDLAIKYNLVQEYNMEIPILQENRTLRIEKAWYSMNRLFLLYSVNLKQNDKNPSDIPTLDADELTFRTTKGAPVKLSILKDYPTALLFKTLEKGFVYENRIYKGKILIPNDADNQEFDGAELKNITLNSPILTKGAEKKEITQLEDIILDLKYKFNDNMALQNVNIDRDTKLANGDTIHWDEFHVGLYHNALYFSMKPQNAKITGFDLDFEFSNSKENMENIVTYNSYTYRVNYDGDKTFIYMPSFKNVPESISIQLDNVQYSGEEVIQLTIPSEDIKAFYEHTLNAIPPEKEIEVGRTSENIFTFAGLPYGDQKMMIVNIGVRSIDEEDNPFGVQFIDNARYEGDLKKIQEDKDHSPFFYRKFEYPTGPVVKITNEDGLEASYEDIARVAIGQTNYQYIYLKDLPVIREAKQLNVDIFNIPKQIELKDTGEIKIELE